MKEYVSMNVKIPKPVDFRAMKCSNSVDTKALRILDDLKSATPERPVVEVNVKYLSENGVQMMKNAFISVGWGCSYSESNNVLKIWDPKLAAMGLLTDLRERIANPGTNGAKEFVELFNRCCWLLGVSDEDLEGALPILRGTSARWKLGLSVPGRMSRVFVLYLFVHKAEEILQN